MKSPFDYNVKSILRFFDAMIENANADINYHFEELRSYQTLHFLCKYFPNRSCVSLSSSSSLSSADYHLLIHQNDQNSRNLYSEYEQNWANTIVHYLIVNRNAEINGKDDNDETPLQKALKYGNQFFVHLLISNLYLLNQPQYLVY